MSNASESSSQHSGGQAKARWLPRLGLVALAISGLIAGLLAAAHLPPRSVEQEVKGFPGFGGEFTLASAAGEVNLSDYRDQVVAIYFGYASCPDVCPTSLGMLASALRQLEPEEQGQAHGLFISVDPERDSPELSNAYAQHFHSQIAGVTGTPAQIEQVAKQYGVLYVKVPLEESAMGYVVDHSSNLFIVGKDGIVKSILGHDMTPSVIVESLREALKERV